MMGVYQENILDFTDAVCVWQFTSAAILLRPKILNRVKFTVDSGFGVGTISSAYMFSLGEDTHTKRVP